MSEIVAGITRLFKLCVADSGDEAAKPAKGRDCLNFRSVGNQTCNFDGFAHTLVAAEFSTVAFAHAIQKRFGVIF